MEAPERLIAKQLAHLDAARRIKAGMEQHAEARVGLGKCLDFHVARARTLAGALCELTPAAGGRELPATGARARL